VEAVFDPHRNILSSAPRAGHSGGNYHTLLEYRCRERRQSEFLQVRFKCSVERFRLRGVDGGDAKAAIVTKLRSEFSEIILIPGGSWEL